MSSRYNDYTTTFTPSLRSGNHDVSSQAGAYFRGLMQSLDKQDEVFMADIHKLKFHGFFEGFR